MIELKRHVNFGLVYYNSPAGTIKETSAEVTLRIPIKQRKDMDDLIDLIIDNIRIRKELEYKAKNPMAFNYNQFAGWVSELLVPMTEKEKQEEREKIIWSLKKS